MDDEPDRVSEPTTSETIADMSFNMEREWHDDFKLRAVKERISMKELQEIIRLIQTQ
ncbi:hypothetical protein [Mesorhizobium sangaii]|uniref:Uncharacterized protein n=1 Tax=Mesorhizobium sangaii TaxID=505389 RepID=A0A841PGK3_9HYPH|nr:hypothetical protein [Mesorhizobium sangaii]MBB6414276.1 hypothetical protein [Mesorhizobium sangaii]